MPQDVVELTIIALGGTNICGNSVATVWSCSANDCVDEDPTFTVGQTTFCLDEPSYQLTALEPGGTWSGTGVDASGLFTPADAGVGTVIITYSYTDINSCDQDGTITLEVVEPLQPPMVECGQIDPTSISFIISHTEPSVTDFEYTYSVNGGTSMGPLPSTGIATVNGLTNGDEVTISVVAIGVPPCGNSEVATQSCEIPPCDDLDPVFSGIEPEYCIEDNSVIVLSASPAGGTWSGTGVDADGTFHPDQFSMGGTTTLTYSWLDASTNCAQEGDITLNLVDPMPPAVVSCASSTQTSVTFNIDLPAGATSYTYEYTVNGGPLQGPFGSSQAMETVSGLDIDDEVEIFVTVLGNNICGDSEVSTFSCISDGCIYITPTVTYDNVYCSSDLPVTFTADPTGGVFSGNGIDAGGEFNPTTAGTFDITYTYTDVFGCESPLSFQVDVIEANEAPIVSCGTSTLSSVTFEWTSGGATDFEYSYSINGGPLVGPISTTDLFVTVNGLSINDQVEIVVTGIGSSPCSNVSSNPTVCQALDCPTDIFPTISGNNGPYCEGDAGVQLTGLPAGGTFSGTNVNASGLFDPVLAGSYTITYTYVEGGQCPYEVVEIIEVEAPLAAPTVGCGGVTESTVTFNISGGTEYEYTYTVNGGAVQGPFTTTNSSIEVSGLLVFDDVEISVAIVGSGPCGNSPTASAICTTFACPDVEIQFGTAPSYCTNEAMAAVQLDVTIVGGNGMTQGVWSGDCVDANGVFDPGLCGATTNQTITYTYEEIDGCEVSNSLVVEISDAPVAEAGNAQTWTCGSTSITLNGAGSSGADIIYNWTGSGPGTIISGGNSLSPVIDGPGTFTLSVENSVTGCVEIDQVVIPNDVNAPVATATDGFISCDQETFTLFAQPTGTNYSYEWSGPGINATNMNQPNPVVSIPGPYSVIVTDMNNNCTDQANALVDDLTGPPLAIISSPINTIDCTTSPFNMEAVDCNGADPNLVYEWYFAGTLIENGCAITVKVEGVYTLIVLNTLTGCEASDQFEVTNSIAYPIAAAEVTDEIDCNTPSIFITGTGSQTGNTISYSWSGPGIISDPNQLTVEVNAEGPYTLTVSESVTGCSNDTTLFVQDLSGALPLADAGEDQELDCQDNPVELSGSGSGSVGGVSLEWFDESDQMIGNGASVMVNEVGIYQLQVTDTETGCSQSSFVNVLPPADAPVGLDLDVQRPGCEGDTDGFINIAQVLGGQGPFLYSFDDEEYSSSNFISNLAPGQYPISIEDANGCTYEEMVEIEEPPIVDIDAGVDIELEYGDSAVVQAQISVPLENVQSIVWQPSWAVECLTEPCYQVEVQTEFTTDLFATVITDDGCEAEDRITVIVRKINDVYWPNVFSPDNLGAGENDSFGPLFDPDKVEMIEQFIIADRWGEIVFIRENLEPNDFDLFWDGRLDGKLMNPAVFVYYAKIKFTNQTTEEFTGDVTLIR
ncbi:MAG: hypothetical protein HKN16_07035 [Saprospiraceae bacterium]|nr:hypothetical protein [Saprospiraceae bacterium]